MSNLNAYNLRDVIIRMSQRDSQFEQDRRIIKGITVGKDASNTCAVTGREGYIWVKELGLPGGVVQVFNTVVPELVNLPVLIGYAPKPPFRRQVIGVNWSDIQTYNWYTGSGSYGSGIHAPTHEWPDGGAGNDVVNVFRRAIVPLRVYPGTGTGIYAGVNINVAPMYYDYQGIVEYYAGEDNVDLSAYVPTGMSLTYVLVYLNVVTNTLGFASETYTGTPIVGDSSPGTNIEDHLPYFPTIPENSIPSAVVVLNSAATSVGEEYIIDIRSLWNIYQDFNPITFTSPSILTIDSDASITVTGDYHHVSGGGLYTVLDTINGGEDYQILVLKADTGDTITVEHNAGGVYNNGNIYLNSGQDFELSGEKTLLLFFNGTVWSDFGDGIGNGSNIDPDAIHDNVPGEIAAIAEKASPVDEDWVLIEDSEDSNNKKRAQLGNLPGGGGGGSGSLLFSQTVDATVENTTSETSLLSAGRGSKILPANTLEQGSAIRVQLVGYVSDTGNPTIDIKVKLGGAEVCSTGAQNINTSISQADWRADVLITCRSAGASGAVVAGGLFGHDDGTHFGMVKTTETAMDTTGELQVEVTATWGTADAADVIVCQQATIELMSSDGLAPVGPTELAAQEI